MKFLNEYMQLQRDDLRKVNNLNFFIKRSMISFYKEKVTRKYNFADNIKKPKIKNVLVTLLS